MNFNCKYGTPTREREVTGLGVYFVSLGEEAFKKSFIICHKLRQEGIPSELYYDSNEKLKKQLRKANKEDAQFVIIIGENELKEDIVILKDMVEREQKNILVKDNDVSELLKELEENLF